MPSGNVSVSTHLFNPITHQDPAQRNSVPTPFLTTSTQGSRAEGHHHNGIARARRAVESEQRVRTPSYDVMRGIVENNDNSTAIPQSVSAPDAISMSPAAMFLSAFSPTPSILSDSEGEVISGYTLGSIIGYGAFSTIRQAFSSSGDVVAVKIIRHSDSFKQNKARKDIEHEAAIWSTLSHEHILPLFSALHTSYADFFFTLYCPAGSLFDILKRNGSPALPQDDAGMMFRQVVRGLRYLHEVVMYVHRDIKLENVLVDEMGICRIGDFGMAKKIGQLDEDENEMVQKQNAESFQPSHAAVHRALSFAATSAKRPILPRGGSRIQPTRHQNDGSRHLNSMSSTLPAHSPQVFQPGSLPYASPELLLPQLLGPILPHPAQDIWALGVLLYALLTGRLPFVDSFEPRVQMKILNGAYELPPGIGRGAERVLHGCLNRSVSTRWTIAKVDEVAWSVGWGTEGDNVALTDSDEEFESHSLNKPSSSPSRSPNNSLPPSPEWKRERRLSRSSLKAASRRSSSRLKRSLSRASVLRSRSSSMKSSSGRSSSHHPIPPSPSISTVNTIVRTNNLRTLSISHNPLRGESALVISPTSFERGRRLKKTHIRYSSQSSSPSVVPTTPSDILARSPAPRPAPRVGSDDVECSSSGRRQEYGQRLHTHHSEELLFPVDVSELDILDETSDWKGNDLSYLDTGVSSGPFKPAMEHESDTFIGPMIHNQSRSQLEPLAQKKRPGSLPPTSTLLWPSSGGKGTGMFVTPVQTPNLSSSMFVASALASSLDGLTKRVRRSRSLELLRQDYRLRGSSTTA